MIRTRIGLLTMVVVTLAMLPAFGEMRALPVPELVANAEFIVVARVEEQTAQKDSPEGQPNQKNILRVEKVLKGSMKESDFFTFLTFKPAEGVYFEDNLVFPEKEEKVIAFLKKSADGQFFPVNGIQGIWPLDKETGTPYKMGSGYSLADIEKTLSDAFKSH